MATCATLLLVSAACADHGAAEPNVVHANAATIDGTWLATDEVPGSSERWTLSVSGSSVTGTGTWTAEACCGGTVDITGNITGDSLHLNVVRVRTMPPAVGVSDPLPMVAVLKTETDLFATDLGGSNPIHFVKANGG